LTLIGDIRGRPIARCTLTLLIRKAVEKAGLPPECVAHGLRKAQMRRLAECGASTKQIAAISGHKTLQEVERYTAAVRSASPVSWRDCEAEAEIQNRTGYVICLTTRRKCLTLRQAVESKR